VLGVIISEIKKETLNTKKVLLDSDFSQAGEDLITCYSRALATLKSREQQVFTEVKEKIILLALQATLEDIQTKFNSAKQDDAISKSIEKLGGQL
jgi:hypothetical protein